VTIIQADGDRLLEALGIPEDEEALYRLLVRSTDTSPTALAHELDTSAARVRRMLKALETRGLVSRTPGKNARFAPAPPAVAWEVLIQQRQIELDRARAAARQFEDDFRSTASAREVDLVEVVSGAEAVVSRFRQLLLLAKEEVLTFDKPPYLNPFGPPGVEEERIRHGVRFAVIYDPEALEYEGKMEDIEEITAAGEDARILPVPMKLLISDRNLALVRVNLRSAGPTDSALLVYPSALLDALIRLWEMSWAEATPFHRRDDFAGSESDESRLDLSEREVKVIDLLLAGAPSESIARRLKMSKSTVERDIATILMKLGAQTRFQAGYKLGAVTHPR
jgi:sugar-specific transcriptional regulator TrmB/DNA-binding CsgD family transcriptional regulator